MGDEPKALAPICNKLGIKANDRVWIGGHHLESKKLATHLLAGITKPPTGPLDNAIITPKTPEEAAYFANKLRDRIRLNGKIWIIVEEKNSLIETGDSQTANNATAKCIQKALANTGFQSVGIVQLNPDFQAVAFKPSPNDDSETSSETP